MAEENFLSGIHSDGKIKVNIVPNSQGSILTHNANTKEISTRTNAEIISDLGLVTQPQAGNFMVKDNDNVVKDTDWAITSETGDGQFKFVQNGFGYPQINWGSSLMTFTDEGMIDLFNYGFRQEDDVGTNIFYYETYFKSVLFQNSQGVSPFIVNSNTVVNNLNADFLDGYHASSFAFASDLGKYVLKTGDTMTGRLDMFSTNGIGSWASNSAASNYLTWRKWDNTGALAYIGGDGGGITSDGNGLNFGIRAVSGDLRLLTDTGNITANNEIVATRPWVTNNFVPKGRTITINGVTQDLSVNRNWDIVASGNYIPNTPLMLRPISNANDALGTDFYYLSGTNKPTGVTDGVLQNYSYDNSSWNTQMFSDWRTNQWYVRVKNAGIWGNWQKIWHDGNFLPGNYIPTSHVSYTITQFNLNQWLTYYGYSDVRQIKPSDTPIKKLQFGFGSFGNNNINPWADWIHFGGFDNSTGGYQNLITFNKEGFGIRQYQGVSQSTTPYTNFVEYWHTGNFNPNGFVKIGGAGTFTNPVYLGWDNNNLRLTIDNSYLGYLWHSGNISPVTTNTYQEIISRKVFSGASGNTYDSGAIMINGNGSSLFPTIGFHQPGIVGATLSVRNDSNLYFNDSIIWNSSNLNLNNFVTLSGAPQTISSLKTFNANAVFNGNVSVTNVLDIGSGFALSNDVNGGDYGLYDQQSMVDLVAGTWNGFYCYGTEYSAYNGIMINKATKMVGINTIPGGNALTVGGAVQANGLIGNSVQDFDEIWTTDGSSRNVGSLGKRTIQFNFEVDGLQHLIPLQPVHSLAVVPVWGSGVENTMIVLPKEARLGQEVEIINHSDAAIYVASQGNTSSPTLLYPGDAMRAIFEIDASPGDINEDRFRGGYWLNVRIYKYNRL